MTEPCSPICESDFGITRRGERVSLFTLVNQHGVTARITNYGGILTSLLVPDRAGVFENVVLGHASLGRYEIDSRYFGALIGRFANRIANGQFELDGKRYTLATNNETNHLHGGECGFDRAVWRAESSMTDDGPSLLLSLVSVDGDQGYPGTLSVKVRYTLSNANSLDIDYEASTDQATPVNLTQHAYFNLTGGAKRDILDHCLLINADYFTPVAEYMVPEGDLRSVSGTPFDFRKAKRVGQDIAADDKQLMIGGGYDHNFVVNRGEAEAMAFVARLSDPDSGRIMDTRSDQPGVQLYTGNFLAGSAVGDDYVNHQALCLETQHFPDSPNQPGFPNTILRPGESFKSRTSYSFSLRADS